MQKKRFRILAFILAVVAILGVSAGWALAKEDSKLIFSGMTMEAKADGSVQGFLNFKVKNIESNGVDYTLEYDTDYVELSDVDTNEKSAEIMDGTPNPPFLKMNDEDFPQFVLNQESSGGTTGDPVTPADSERSESREGSSETVGEGDEGDTGEVTTPESPGENLGADNNQIKMDPFVVMAGMPAAEGKYAKVSLKAFLNPLAEGPNIGEKFIGGSSPLDSVTKVILAGDKELKLGSLSFRIKDPEAFAKLNDRELMNVFRVETNDGGASAFSISYVDMTSYPPVVFYDGNSHLDYEFNVKNTIKEVEVDASSQTVTAAEVFAQGDESDLLSYLNSFMQDVTVTYADGSQIADTIVWGDRDKNYKCDNSWDPKGGTYNVTQEYADGLVVSATLEVTPVSIVGYLGDKDFVAYDTSEDVPADFSAFKPEFPKTAKPIFSVMLPVSFTYNFPVDQDSWKQTQPTDKDLFPDKAAGQYTFTGDVDVSGMPRWATVPSDLEAVVNFDVAVGARTPDPQVVITVDDDGLMTITVTGMAGLDTLPNDLNFMVRMPNGEVLDPANFTNVTGGGLYEVSLNSPSNGQATIKLKAENISNAQQAALQQAINLGNRLGSFGVAAKQGELPRSKWVSASADPRTNIYVDKNYVFDYSVTGSQIFNIADDMTVPPTTITLVGTDSVATLYSGYDGTEPGSLRTVVVESWTMTEGAMNVGETVTFEGKLADTSYTNYGEVTNRDNVTITLKLKVVAATDPEKIKDIDDFCFDKKRVGYTASDVQTASFDIENIGKSDISGLTVTLDSDEFVLIGNPTYSLVTGGVASFQIRTKEGLPAGNYTGTVTISSNKTAVLDTFNVSFEVVNGPLYRLNLSANPQDGGTAVALDGNLYAAGDTVTLQATPADGYNFGGWEVTAGTGVTFVPDANTDAVTFEMPDLEALGVSFDYVTIQAHFSPTNAAKLRLQDLRLFNPDDTVNDLLGSDYSVVNFDPQTREYWAIAPSGADKNKAEFTITPPDDGSTIDVGATLQQAGGTATALTVDDKGAGAYTIEEISLVSSGENTLVITLTSGEDSRTYTVHIYRRQTTEDMVRLAYGNSPYGLIMKDSAVADADKAAWKAEFDKGNCFTAGYTPAGGKQGLVYHPDAWGSSSQAVNYDKVDEALFVYSGESFEDPGIVGLTDSLGRTIDIAADPSLVKREIKVEQMTSTTSKNLMDDFRTVVSRTMDLGSGSTVNVLESLRVRPGVYAIEYTFEDFDGTEISVQRPLIVLAGRGDVNIDKNIDETDAALLANRYNAMLPYANLPGFDNGSMLYKYRVCDTNVDRNINIGDSNMILQHKNDMVQFYK